MVIHCDDHGINIRIGVKDKVHTVIEPVIASFDAIVSTDVATIVCSMA